MDNQKAEVSRKREAALALHRAGKLDEARAGYERLLASAPGDPDLLGVLGVVALQEGNLAEAEALLRRAVGATHPAPHIQLRNLNNLFTLLFRERRTEDMAALADAGLPDWPADCVPDVDDRARAASLSEALGVAGRPDRGAQLLESLLAGDDSDLALHDLCGRLWLNFGDAALALPHLQRAAADESPGWLTLAALSAALGTLGQDAAATAAALRCARTAPVYLAPKTAGQRATILALNPSPKKITGTDGSLGSLHFTTNFIAEASRALADEFRFASTFAELPDHLPELPEADVVFNNLASGEVLSKPEKLEWTIALVEQLGRPVINPPEAVWEMTRQKTAARLRDIPGLRVPRIERYWRDLSRFDEIEAHIASVFTYPVIVRHVASDSSSKKQKVGQEMAKLIADGTELRAFLERIKWPQFYVIQYVDLRKLDGNYRKMRATFVGEDIIVSRCQFRDMWMVGNVSGTEFYDRFPGCVVQIRDILRDPETALDIPLFSILREVRSRVPLDIFGMDFDVDDDGKVVIFEAQSTMMYLPDPNGPDYAIAPKEPGDRILKAFVDLVRTKIDAKV